MIYDAAFSLDFKSSRNASRFLKQLLMNDEIAMYMYELILSSVVLSSIDILFRLWFVKLSWRKRRLIVA